MEATSGALLNNCSLLKALAIQNQRTFLRTCVRACVCMSERESSGKTVGETNSHQPIILHAVEKRAL